MKTSISGSEKRSWKTVGGEFVSREFAYSREIEVPDTHTPAQRQVIEAETLYEVRHAVLMPFVLENAMSQAEYQTAMALYAGLVDAARQALNATGA